MLLCYYHMILRFELQQQITWQHSALTALETASVCHSSIVLLNILYESGRRNKYKAGNRDESYIFTYEH
jgi:hypothetical protein